jgi:putative transposase
MQPVVRGFKYRFYPTPEQAVALSRTFGSVRFVYNWALNLRTQAWYGRRERVNYARTSAELTTLKKQPETAWLNEVSSVPTQQALRNLQTAFTNFWGKRAAYPSFKKKGHRGSAEFTRSAFRWDGRTLSLAKIGALRIKWSRRFTVEPSTVIISRTPSGRYYVTFRLDETLVAMSQTQGAVGIDLGLLDFAATSNGSKYQSPRPLKRKMAQLKRAQKALSRKQKGSKNRAKARVRVAKIHEKIADIRQDFLHKLSTKLVRENQTIVVEDLNVRGMMANHKLAGAISDSGWSEFTRQLTYKCEWYGRRLVRIDRWFPSSKRCSKCGHIADSMPLNVRQWECMACGAKHDRDVNAAINILAAGRAVTACGEGVRPSRPQGWGGNPRRSRNHSVRCA